MSEGISLDETPAERRNRLLRTGTERAKKVASDCLDDLLEGEIATSQIKVRVNSACQEAYELGIETMADIALPQVATADASAMETRLQSGRDTATGDRLRALPVQTTSLAINAMIRLLVEQNTNRTIRRWPARAELPVEEANALVAVAEAAMGMNTAALLESGLFEILP